MTTNQIYPTLRVSSSTQTTTEQALLSHPSTNQVQRCLTSVIIREQVFPPIEQDKKLRWGAICIVVSKTLFRKVFFIFFSFFPGGIGVKLDISVCLSSIFRVDVRDGSGIFPLKRGSKFSKRGRLRPKREEK